MASMIASMVASMIASDGLSDCVPHQVCKMTGKEKYEFGDLSTVLDTRVKRTVADFCGKV